MENCSSEMLNRAMRNAGIRNGFEDISAEFSAYREFKLKWTRFYKLIGFEVSDYLRNAPEHVMQSLAETPGGHGVVQNLGDVVLNHRHRVLHSADRRTCQRPSPELKDELGEVA